ncbi:hypothetical protein [Lapidilactobacillus gannanensis]|uniref:Glycosyl hydrolase family 13 catalytic domain-containing protein n=1 Tax=Lapidilactobacillus gannanensis TaxID=2486002 RepID=A0ABW4BL49_9LACO|nr:hypothetical protein [Lapidilactobacillus gannanensis]
MMLDTDPKLAVTGWLAKEDPEMLAETDRLSFFLYLYELLAKNDGIASDFTGFTLEPLLNQPQILGYRDAYRADPEGFEKKVLAAYQQQELRVNKSLATMAYVLVKNNPLAYLQDFVQGFDFWKNWQKNHRPSTNFLLSNHDQERITQYFLKNK